MPGAQRTAFPTRRLQGEGHGILGQTGSLHDVTEIDPRKFERKAQRHSIRTAAFTPLRLQILNYAGICVGNYPAVAMPLIDSKGAFDPIASRTCWVRGGCLSQHNSDTGSGVTAPIIEEISAKPNERRTRNRPNCLPE